MPIVNRIAAMKDEITEWRQDLHSNPELLYDVHRTAQQVADRLRAFGCDEVTTGIGRTGVVGVIRGRGHASGRVIGLRADMDALPMPEDTGHEFASRNAGKMHACGHDAHTAMLVGAAHLLDRHRDALAGDVLFMFQPACQNRIYVHAGSVLGVPDTEKWKEIRESGVDCGITYLSAVAALAAARIEQAARCGQPATIQVKMAKLPSDINIRIEEYAMRFITHKKKKVDLRGPVFFTVRSDWTSDPLAVTPADPSLPGLTDPGFWDEEGFLRFFHCILPQMPR